MDAPGDKYALF